ncbi:MAG TPA: CDP-diacylglycerol--glycerol-3-phosphate 3-phosphatidyltransferase [Mesotoga infera]|uniref:CDP-diacylglycerol--glycerol-3-phosphate 3-phosphatidyltransferase n=1 Tax=Mesotoga infera TaxID=1236046 RepID=A0A7C1H9D5_9BACT|nr:CDP-diacylglycerol--glycerol-3-phosphate 3-phosphatidyltransferase [Mesotoga infera]
MNLPNILTLSRMVLALPVLLLLTTGNAIGNYFSFVIFLIASLTDFFDGRIARKRGLVTDLGKFLDQIADKILVTSIFLGFMALSRVSLWFLFILVTRDTLVSGIRMVASNKGKVIAADIFGKAKTVSQMTLLILLYSNLLWGIPPGEMMLWLEVVIAAITAISGANYLLKNIDIFRGGK